jgi:hypothetical protein
MACAVQSQSGGLPDIVTAYGLYHTWYTEHCYTQVYVWYSTVQYTRNALAFTVYGFTVLAIHSDLPVE